MTISRFSAAGLLVLSAVPSAAAPYTPGAWTYNEFSSGDHHSAEAAILSRDRTTILAINCSISGEHTVSIQYRPGSLGLSMAPVTLDWVPPTGTPLSSKLVWEPDERGAFARDSVDDRNASEVAEAIKSKAGTLRLTAADDWGRPVEMLYDSHNNLDAIGRVVAQCPWHPQSPSSAQ